VRGPSGLAMRTRWRALVSVALLSLLVGLGVDERLPVNGGSASALADGSAGEPIEASPELAFNTGEDRGGKFGSSVAVSSDGRTALVGAPTENAGAGAAWVFTRVPSKNPKYTEWDKGSELTMPPEASQAGDCGDETPEEEGGAGQAEGAATCRFGISVALSSAGDIAVVGAPHANQNGGAVWIFTRSGTSWTRAAELPAPEAEAKDRFGRSVAISADGSTVLIGAPMWRGRAWVFTHSGSGWSPAELAGNGGEGEGAFGHSVALSADGETALIGAPGYLGDPGAAWVFHRSASGWSEAGAELEGKGKSPEGRFGISVALSGSGGTALVGARENDGGKGAAWVFTASGAAWSEQGPALTGAGAAEEEFGASVALSAQGDAALVGATHDEGARGAAWLFEGSGAGWAAREELHAGAMKRVTRHVLFGSSVALSSDAQTRLVGGRAAEGHGVAWVFGLNPAVEAVQPARGPSSGGTSVTITGEHLANATAVRFGESEASIVTRTSQKSITVVSPPGKGTVDVTVENPAGLSAETSADRFTYTEHGGKGEEGEAGMTGGESPTGGSANAPARVVVLPFGPVAGGACGALLLHRKIGVQSHGRALLKLRGTGPGACSGRLTLRVRVKLAKSSRTRGVSRKYRMRTIGSAAFSIASGRTLSIAVKLNPAGRRLLRAGHGRLNASLLIVRYSPAPAQARSASVRLTLRKTRKSSAKKT
jgi:IPT/TIG domain/FG-GAP repeat